jgi:ABC-type multidrug transport system fused ATPase/permease subunit
MYTCVFTPVFMSNVLYMCICLHAFINYHRFYKPDAGEITIDGIDMADLDRQWLTKRIALVGQNPALFSGTIATNIAYGAPPKSITLNSDSNSSDSTLNSKTGSLPHLNGATMAEIESAAKLANAHEFIMQFPLG